MNEYGSVFNDFKGLFMKRFIMAVTLISIPFIGNAEPEDDDTYWQCKALCEHYAPDTKNLFWGFVEFVDVDLNIGERHISKLAKYRRELRSAVNVLNSAFSYLKDQCFDMALDTESVTKGTFSQRLVDPKDPSKLANPESVCIELKDDTWNQ